jgi:hypothetical protein
MFDSLDEQIKKDEDKESTTRERVLRYLAIVAVAVLIIGGLALAVQHIH